MDGSALRRRYDAAINRAGLRRLRFHAVAREGRRRSGLTTDLLRSLVLLGGGNV